MNTQSSTQLATESGNVIFIILIGVAMLAALTYAVSGSIRGGTQDMSAEKARLYAAEILEYSSVISNAVAQLRLRGVTEAQLCFDDSNWTADYNHAGCLNNDNKIFHFDGGGAIWQEIPVEALAPGVASQEYTITGANAVNQIFTTEPEITIMATNLSDAVCAQMNRLLNLSSGTAVLADTADVGFTPYIGTFFWEATIGSGTTFSDQKAGCFYNDPNGYNIFYKVLLAR